MQVTGVTLDIPVLVPLVSRPVRAGFPSPADDIFEEEIGLRRLPIVNRSATFLVQVVGDRTTLAYLFDGDLAVRPVAYPVQRRHRRRRQRRGTLP